MERGFAGVTKKEMKRGNGGGSRMMETRKEKRFRLIKRGREVGFVMVVYSQMKSREIGGEGF